MEKFGGFKEPVKYRYYVVPLEGDPPMGTNDLQDALDFAESEYYLVIDSEKNEMMLGNGKVEAIQPIDKQSE